MHEIQFVNQNNVWFKFDGTATRIFSTGQIKKSHCDPQQLVDDYSKFKSDLGFVASAFWNGWL